MKLFAYKKIILLAILMVITIGVSVTYIINGLKPSFPADLSDIHWKRLNLPVTQDQYGGYVPGLSMEVPDFMNINELGALSGTKNGVDYGMRLYSVDLSIKESGQVSLEDAELLRKGNLVQFIRHQSELVCKGPSGLALGISHCTSEFKSFTPIEKTGVRGVLVDAYQYGSDFGGEKDIDTHNLEAWFYDKNTIFYLWSAQFETQSERARAQYPEYFKDPRHLDIFRHAIDTLKIDR